MTVVERILAHPRVESISDEREWARTPPGEENGDGFWVYFAPGFIDPSSGVHGFHENSPSECLALLRTIKPCRPGCECGI